MSNNIAKCPHCKRSCELDKTQTMPIVRYRGCCWTCGYRGPWCDTPEEAIEAHNGIAEPIVEQEKQKLLCLGYASLITTLTADNDRLREAMPDVEILRLYSKRSAGIHLGLLSEVTKTQYASDAEIFGSMADRIEAATKQSEAEDCDGK